MGGKGSTVLVVTGAAATGKTTIGHHLRRRPDVLVIDGDVLGSGAAAEDEVVHFLALLSDPGTVRRRIAERPQVSPPASPDQHVAFDASLRAVRVPTPHTWTTHDVARSDLATTLSVADAWATRWSTARA